MPHPKKPIGRPATRNVHPERIPDTPQNVTQALVKTRSRPERNALERK